MATRRGLIFFFFFFSVIVPTLLANIGEVDDYLKEVEQEALAHFHRTYNPNPEHVVKHINEHINRTLAELEDTRRELRGKGAVGGPCEATNPIDKCWRCNPNWEKDRKKLADCALGFAKGTIGGKMGPIYVVTDGTDADVQNPKPGTLRHAVIQKGPLWITFARSMVIKLSQELLVSSDKTIDGRGANVHIAFGGGISIQFVRNIIIHGLHIHDTVSLPGGMIRDSVDHVGQRTKSDGDGINIFGSSNIWIDHISGYACEDGLVDVIQASTGITISNCHFTDHNDVMLFGAQDTFKEDAKMQITLAFNHFGKGLVQRMPRARYCFVHLVNNDIKWEMYAIGGSYAPTIVSQGNRYHAPNNEAAKKLTKKDYRPEQVVESRNWAWISQGDLLMNGAIFEASGDPGVTKRFPLIGPLPADQVPALTKNSGAMDCVIGKPC